MRAPNATAQPNLKIAANAELLLRITAPSAVLWLIVALESRHHSSFTLIDVLFLLGSFVIVPLGLYLASLTGAENGIRAHLNVPLKIAPWIQLPAAILILVSFHYPPGIVATLFVIPWFCFGAFLGVCGLLILARKPVSLPSLCLAASLIYLPVGCAWLIASRYGLTPMNFQEPIVLLTAVHFHFAGFAAPLLALAAARHFAQAPRAATRAIFKIAAIGVICGPGLLAVGFVAGPHVKLVAAFIVALSEVSLAAFFIAALRAVVSRAAQLLLFVSAASVLFSMSFAVVWAVGEFPLQPFVHLAEMAKFHGVANALGFTLCGLLGWILALRPPTNAPR
jgi:hypothetical protein